MLSRSLTPSRRSNETRTRHQNPKIRIIRRSSNGRRDANAAVALVALRSIGPGVVEELYNILNSEFDKVNREMFYVGDAPIDLLDWTNAFSMELVGTPVRVVVPQRSIRSARP